MDYASMAEKNMILKARVGSHLFGTNTPDSDLDMEGIFIPPVSVVFGLGQCKEVDLGKVSKDDTGRNTSEAVDFKIREYREFVRLAIQNNPNILNILFVNEENTLYLRDAGFRLLEKAEMFPHRKGLERFIGYAMSQMKKMGIKPENYDRLRSAETFLDGQDPAEIISNIKGYGIKDHGPGSHIQIGDIFLERGQTVKRALIKVRGRLSRASARAAMWEEHGYDCKFAANLIQILEEGIELAQKGRLDFPLACADLILEIKRGEYSIEWIRAEGQRLIDALSYQKRNSTVLPAGPRREIIEGFVIRELEKSVGKDGYV
jgi:hypothetical protein